MSGLATPHTSSSPWSAAASGCQRSAMSVRVSMRKNAGSAREELDQFGVLEAARRVGGADVGVGAGRGEVQKEQRNQRAAEGVSADPPGTQQCQQQPRAQPEERREEQRQRGDRGAQEEGRVALGHQQRGVDERHNHRDHHETASSHAAREEAHAPAIRLLLGQRAGDCGRVEGAHGLIETNAAQHRERKGPEDDGTRRRAETGQSRAAGR